MPLDLDHLTKKDIRKMQIDHCTDRLGRNMVESTIKRQFNDYFLTVLHPFLVVFNNCTRPRCRGPSGKMKRLEAILENIEGYDLFPEDRVDAETKAVYIRPPIHVVRIVTPTNMMKTNLLKPLAYPNFRKV